MNLSEHSQTLKSARRRTISAITNVNFTPLGKPDPIDAEVRAVLVNAMAEVGADPALIYAFRKTGVYVCTENERRLPKSSLRAFDAAVGEYYAALDRPPQ